MPVPEPELSLAIFRCGNPMNLAHWCNPDFDALFDRAQQEPDRRKRLMLLRKAEEIMVNDVPDLALSVMPYDKFLAKPVRIDELVSAIEEYLDPA